MKRQITLIALSIVCACGILSALAQEGSRVNNIKLFDLDNNATSLPHWGKKNLIIFYVDPDRMAQNDEFIKALNECEKLKNGAFFGVSVMNLADAPKVSKPLAYKMAKKRSVIMKAPFLIDERASLSSTWELGDCDNQSSVALLNTSGEIIFFCKGRVDEVETKRFLDIVEGIK